MRLAYLVPLLGLTSCATPTANSTSGHPEIIINKAPETVQACVTQGLIARGWRVRSDNPGKVVFSKQAGPTPGTDAPYGTVATLSFVPGKVITNAKMVTDFDTGEEEPMLDSRPDMTGMESAVMLCR